MDEYAALKPTRPQGGGLESLEELVLRLAAVGKELDRRSGQAAEQVDAGAAALQEAARFLAADADRFVRDAMRITGDAARLAVAQGAGGALAEFKQGLRLGTTAVERTTRALDRECHALAVARRHLVWRGVAVLWAAAALAASGLAGVAWSAARQVDAAALAHDVAQAMERGALIRCGDELCVKAGSKPRRYAADPDYVVLPK